MSRKLNGCAAVASLLLAAYSHAETRATAQQKMASVQYLVGSWHCHHTVGTFSGTYTTTYTRALGDLWLKQTYDFPPTQTP
jgi:outer membrane lipoprotein-sorting protein